MAEYPLVVRNDSALFARGFMVAFVGCVGLVTYAAAAGGAPEAGRWWPWILLLFWAVGLGALVHTFNGETSVVRVLGPRMIEVRRGKAFRRQDHRIDRARFWIDETRDSDGDPYFLLMMDAPGGKMAVKEGHNRPGLEALQARLEAAVRPA